MMRERVKRKKREREMSMTKRGKSASEGQPSLLVLLLAVAVVLGAVRMDLRKQNASRWYEIVWVADLFCSKMLQPKGERVTATKEWTVKGPPYGGSEREGEGREKATGPIHVLPTEG